ncbi:type II toxin-antitoxin system VapC family toxin [Bosea sp. CS1GBMeth4]|uniref:type II toxin-antitoxin system VapC family toxin n=1 Tax=Bosea sp. CS1GBMeth4 TaxID=1892849 RepID=UPI001644C9B7|nr:type II toxin-antitoxin system VapC family toxin [Bosea sp. CS1GBMeth4]
MFLDASIIVAIILKEPEIAAIEDAVTEADRLQTSPLAVFEAASRLVSVKRIDFVSARDAVVSLLDRIEADIIEVGMAQMNVAHVCAARYHRLTNHPACLNMGDCFAYAAALTSGLKLAYTGNDFVHTDIDGIRFGA